MSQKASGAAWDLSCPKKYGDLEFRPTHKFVLLAYVDHADHNGKNIWPSVDLIHKKTGLDERTVQRLTNELVIFGLLIEDGRGPRGTNKFFTPICQEGWQPAASGKETGDNGNKSLGDIPLGDIPLGGTVPHDFKEPEPNQFNISINQYSIWGDAKKKLQDEMLRAEFDTWVRGSFAVHFDTDQNVLWIASHNDYARNWMSNRLTARSQEITGLYVRFMTIHENQFQEAQ